MQRMNLDTLNVRRLNFTDNTIYRLGRPLHLIPTDASGEAHACHQTLGIGTGVCPPDATLHVNGGPGSYAVEIDKGDAHNMLYVKGDVAACVYSADAEYYNIRCTDGKGLALSGSPSDYGESAHMFILDGGNVGIGTNVPGELLDVSGNVNIKNYLYFNDATGASISGSGTDLQFDTGADARMYIANTGKVGIGTKTPSQLLDISGGKVIIHGTDDSAGLDMSCNDISNVKIIYFCDGSGASGGLDMSCNDISNVETIYFCDPSNSSISSGSSLDISTNAIHFNISNNLHALDISSNGYVGIGTDSPSQSLDISGNINIKDKLHFGGSTDASISGSNTYLQFDTSGNSRMRIDNSGNVGIGTDSPLQPLDISGSVNIKDKLHFGGSTDASISGSNTYLQFDTSGNPRMHIDSDGRVGVGTIVPIEDLDISGNVNIENNLYFGGSNTSISGADQYLKIDVGHLTRMYIKNDGNVGIGTDDPGKLLDVSGNMQVRGGNIYLGGDTTESINGSASSHYLSFKTSDLERIRINNEGNMGIGTGDPKYPLDISGNMRVRGNLVFVSENSKDKLAVTLNAGWGSTTFNPGMNFDTSRNYSYYDLENIDVGFKGASFDGIYIYFASYYEQKILVRYDTTENFDTSSSYAYFDLSGVSDSHYTGSVFDGRYIYLIPRNNDKITRYDTTADFDASGSYEDTTVGTPSEGNFNGGVFDGTYLYLLPTSASGIKKLYRYDTTLSSFQGTNFVPFDISHNLIPTNLIAGVFTGRYIYFISDNTDGLIIKYDTEAGAFDASGSYQYYDTSGGNVNSKEFSSGVFDGRYLYLIPGSGASPDSGQITRYDTNASFTNPTSYSYYDTSGGNGNSKGFNGGAFDGRYLYLVPYLRGGAHHGQITRYDTTAVFTDSNSYRFFDTATTGAPGASNSKGFGGCIFDDTYLYFIPLWGKQITRYNTGGPTAQQGIAQLANSSNFYLDSAGNVGIGTDAPSQLLDVSGNVKANSIIIELLDVSGNVKANSFTDIFAAKTNTKYRADLALGTNMGGFGGTTYNPGMNFDTSSNYSYFDTAGGSPWSKGFRGGVFDGRYLYLIPYNYGSFSGVITRYDTTADFGTQSSYSYFNTADTGGDSSSKGFSGGVFDGRYLYLIPYNNSSKFGQITRYDTTADFETQTSYSYHDTTTGGHPNSKGFMGGVFDGRYLYLIPYNNVDGTPGTEFGQITRYDTTAVFTDSTSYSYHNTADVGTGGDANSRGFHGGVFDGRYLYLIPASTDLSGQITRYDTTADFDVSGSYSYFNTETDNSGSKGFNGGVYDGRYLYLIPHQLPTVNVSTAPIPSGQITRYDTTADFETQTSYSYHDTTIGDAYSKGFSGGVFDGRYLYLIPYDNVQGAGGKFGQITRYDTTAVFTDSTSYSYYNTAPSSSLPPESEYSLGFSGGVYDGRYLYLIPYKNDKQSPQYFGQITRFDTGGTTPQQGIAQLARSSNFYLNSAGYVGIGTTSPTKLLDVDGDAKVRGQFLVSGEGLGSGDYGAIIEKADGTNNNILRIVGAGATCVYSDDSDYYNIRSVAGAGLAFGGDIDAYGWTTGHKANMFILNGGNVGIATNDPQYLLDVSGNVNIQGNLYFAGITNTAILGSTYLQFNTGAYARMYIDSTGEVGIGTNNPQYLLDVSGNVNIAGNLYFGGITTTAILGSSYLQFNTGGDSRIYIDVDGRVGIGMVPSSPFTLDVNGRSRAADFIRLGYIAPANWGEHLKADSAGDIDVTGTFSACHFYELGEPINDGNCCILVDGKIYNSTINQDKRVIGFMGRTITEHVTSNTNNIVNQCGAVYSIGDSYEWSRRDINGNPENGKEFFKLLNGCNISNQNGDLETGDYICSCNNGYFMKQEDDILHNYTAGRVMENVIFGENEIVKHVYCIMTCG